MISIFKELKKVDNFILFIYFYLFVMPWNFNKGQMGALTIIMFIWWIFKYRGELYSKIKSILEFKPLVILILFILYSYISILWSDSFSDGFKEINKFHKYYFLLIPVLFTSLTFKEAKMSLKIIVVSFSSYALFSLMIYFGFFTLENNNDIYGPRGIMGYAIVTQYMAMGMIATFIFALFSKNKTTKIIFFLCSIFCLSAVFINNSRTAQLSLVLTITSISLIYYRSNLIKIKNLLLFLLFTILISISSIYLLNATDKFKRFNSAYKNIEKVFKEDKYSGSAGVRIYFNKIGYELFKDNPLLGMGPVDNNLELEKIMINDPSYVYKKTFSSFHSEHMNTLTKYGLVGYLLLFSSIVYLLFLLRKNKEYFLIGCSFYITIFYISFANATFLKKPINYILISVFVLLSIIAYSEYKNRLANNDNSQ